MNQILDDRCHEFNRDLRIRRFKRALAWCGVVAAGSLLVFCTGITVMRTTPMEAAAMVVITILMAWGIWGFVHLKTRH